MNSPKPHFFDHALCAEDLVIPGECPASLDELRASLHNEHQPANTTEAMLVNEIAEQFWRVRRLRACEARGMQPDTIDGSLGAGLLTFIARSMAAAERGLHRAIATLRRLQADRGFVSSKMARSAPVPVDAAGFVPSKTQEHAPAGAHAAGFVPSKTAAPVAAPRDEAQSGPAPSQNPMDFGDLDVTGILAQYDEDLHPIVLEDLALLQSLRKHSKARGLDPGNQ